jgi:hypothetical protein
MNSVKQTETPLNRLYFSQYNVDLLHRGIRQDFLNKTGLAVLYQEESDLRAIMRVVFINNSGDRYSNVNRQVYKVVKAMNRKVIAPRRLRFARVSLTVSTTGTEPFEPDPLRGRRLVTEYRDWNIYRGRFDFARHARVRAKGKSCFRGTEDDNNIILY